MIKTELPTWTETEGPNNDVVLSSRVRVARNLKDHRFPNKADREEREQLLGEIKTVIEEKSYFDKFKWIRLSELSRLDRQTLVEEHVISPAFMTEAATGRALALEPGKTESIMFNEEDHIRLQVIESGMNLKQAGRRAGRIDDELEDGLDFAFSRDFGYKTACPTNLGTARRYSLMLHLPALAIVGAIKDMTSYVDNLGLVVRGLFGEGTNQMGALIQLSNRWAAVNSEDESEAHIERIALGIIDQERNTRERLHFEEKIDFEDRIFRSLAILKGARKLPLDEFMNGFSLVKMGVDMGILPKIPSSVLNRLLYLARPAFLIKMHGLDLEVSAKKLDALRAELVRSELEKA